LDSELNELNEQISFGILPLNPTRIFNVNDKVQYGMHNETYVRETFENGLYYKIESIAVKRTRDLPPENEIRYVAWIELFPIELKQTTLKKVDEHELRFYNSGIDSLLSMIYHSGVDFDVEYQREHVWELNDKIVLIDSIFNNIDIGRFVFVCRNLGFEGKLYEIIDGKQRLTAIKDFFEDRFKYNEFYFSEISNKDKNKFENHPITYGYLDNPTKKAVLETFIKLNTCGKPMDVKHIDNVKKMLKDLE
jgi:hypothetical protein